MNLALIYEVHFVIYMRFEMIERSIRVGIFMFVYFDFTSFCQCMTLSIVSIDYWKLRIILSWLRKCDDFCPLWKVSEPKGQTNQACSVLNGPNAQIIQDHIRYTVKS